jgi:hypothetical protein
MMALALLLTALAIGLLLLKERDRRWPSPAIFLIAAPLGLLICAAVVTVAWYFSITPELSVPVLAVVALLLFAADVWGGRNTGVSGAEVSFHWGPAHLASLVIVALYAFPSLYALAWMGAGTSPPVFFNVDAAYYLTQTHALAQADSYPPLSLNAAGVARPYHYAVQLDGALFARLAGVPAHKALFWIVIPLLVVGKIAVVWRIANLAATRGVPHWLSVLCLVFVVEYPAYLLFRQGVTVAKILRVENLATGLLMLSALAGCFLTYLIALLMIDERVVRRALAIICSVGMLPLVKSAYIVPVGLWVGLWSLYALIVQRRTLPFLVAALSCVLAFGLSHIGVEQGFAFASNLDLGSRLDFIWRAVVEYGAPVFAAALVVFLSRGSRSDVGAPIFRNFAILFLTAATAILWLPILVVVTYHGGIHRNIVQWLAPVVWISSVAVVLGLAAGWNTIGVVRKAWVLGVLAAYLSLPIVAKLHEIKVLIRKPAAWHEFVDNGLITPALAAIPLKGSLIATNDLYYPANNYKRSRRQFQIAALFGHHAYGAGIYGFYDEAPDADERAAKQERLQQPSWTADLSRIACESGWTHVLLSKRLPYVRDVPGTRLYESDAYAVYQLPACEKAF